MPAMRHTRLVIAPRPLPPLASPPRRAQRGALALLFALTGCAIVVRPGSSNDAAPPDASLACGPALTCWTYPQGTIALPSAKVCTSDRDCVVRVFESDRSGTLEIASIAATGAAEFDRAVRACTCSGGIPPGPTFYEHDGGTLPYGTRDASSRAACLAGCCIAVPAPRVWCDAYRGVIDAPDAASPTTVLCPAAWTCYRGTGINAGFTGPWCCPDATRDAGPLGIAPTTGCCGPHGDPCPP